jgi:hypothetical protein
LVNALEKLQDIIRLAYPSPLSYNREMNDDVKDPLQGHGYSSTKSWSTGFWRRFPWTGMFSLIAAILASAFMVQIIAISDGRPIND